MKVRVWQLCARLEMFPQQGHAAIGHSARRVMVMSSSKGRVWSHDHHLAGVSLQLGRRHFKHKG